MLDIDRGEPLTPEQVARKVVARTEALRALGKPSPRAEARIVLHPSVFEDVYFAAASYPSGDKRAWWQGAFQCGLSTATGPASMRCCGIIMDTDPSLRYDEVVLRLDERL